MLNLPWCKQEVRYTVGLPIYIFLFLEGCCKWKKWSNQEAGAISLRCLFLSIRHVLCTYMKKAIWVRFGDSIPQNISITYCNMQCNFSFSIRNHEDLWIWFTSQPGKYLFPQCAWHTLLSIFPVIPELCNFLLAKSLLIWLETFIMQMY